MRVKCEGYFCSGDAFPPLNFNLIFIIKLEMITGLWINCLDGLSLVLTMVD